MKKPTVYFPRNESYKGIVYVNGKSVSVLDHKLGGFNHLTLSEIKELNKVIKHYNL